MIFPSRSLDFARDGRDWPNRAASRFVAAGGLRWHVQEIGADRGELPLVLLLHGTGAATHSWAALVRLLAPHARIVAPDLPGHGFTQQPDPRLFSLPGMAHGVADLLDRLGARPDFVIGHSAGAAVMIRMALDGRIAPKGMVAVNGALKPYGGEANKVLAPLARLLFLNPFMPRLFAWQAGNAASVERLIRNTGSVPVPEMVTHYRTLVSHPDHVAGALGMMANWDLQPLARDLPNLTVPLLLLAGDHDKAIRSEDAFAIRAMAPQVRVEILRGLGHLAHEEAPERVFEQALAFAREVGAIDETIAA